MYITGDNEVCGPHIPGDGICTSVPGQNGRMVDDALVFRVIDHFHRDELRAERQYVQIGTDRLVLFEHFGNDLALLPPRLELEDGHTILTGRRSCMYNI